MGTIEESIAVQQKIKSGMQRRTAKIKALALDLKARMIADFIQRQGTGQDVEGEFWTNRYSEAVNSVFAEVLVTYSTIGFFIAHRQIYGIYLELANDRKYEALRPMIEKWGDIFLKESKKYLEA